MKANELSVGNIVTDEWFDSFKKIITIESINDKGINLEITDDGNWSEIANRFITPEYEFSQLRGIPISEEILLKCGFEKEISNDDEERIIYSIQISNSTSLYFDKHKDWMREDLYVEWYFSHEWNNNHFKNDIGWNNPKYLHQLQNLYFSLTGQELNTSGL